MFKLILPSKRMSPDFMMVTPPPDCNANGVYVPGKENIPEAGRSAGKGAAKAAKQAGGKTSASARADAKAPLEGPMTEEAFNRLLDDLQIPSTLRPKLATMDATVKAAMLKSSQIPLFKPAPPPPHTPRTLRRAHSSDSVNNASPPPVLQPGARADAVPPSPQVQKKKSGGKPFFTHYASKSVVSLGLGSQVAQSGSGHTRGMSYDASRTLGSGTELSVVIPLNGGKAGKEKGAPAKDLSPSRFCAVLTSTSSTQMDVEILKKLRLLLRNESASWSQEFLRVGGYNALLTRLNEILEVEWREEQHDDQILHELLRCFKALSTSEIGCFALRSSCPTPFAQLLALLYSDKKPGDVATRQLIVELMLLLFHLYPPSSLPSTAGRPRRDAFGHGGGPETSRLITLPAPHRTLFALVRALVLTPAPPPAEAPPVPIEPHEFIESLHRPRIYKTYLQEFSDVCRDYFWVFCHPSNAIWNLVDVDEEKVEKPRAPGGMTGGVEFEAMGYLTTHLRLLNAFAKAAEDLNLPQENELSAYRFHSDIFLSGLERVLLTIRKASTVYYPILHLEIARYITLAWRAGYELPWTVSRLVGPPPTALCRSGRGARAQGSRADTSTASSSMGRSSALPALPSPKRADPVRFD